MDEIKVSRYDLRCIANTLFAIKQGIVAGEVAERAADDALWLIIRMIERLEQGGHIVEFESEVSQ